jgi:hypothetical protein
VTRLDGLGVVDAEFKPTETLRVVAAGREADAIGELGSEIYQKSNSRSDMVIVSVFDSWKPVYSQLGGWSCVLFVVAWKRPCRCSSRHATLEACYKLCP